MFIKYDQFVIHIVLLVQLVLCVQLTNNVLPSYFNGYEPNVFHPCSLKQQLQMTKLEKFSKTIPVLAEDNRVMWKFLMGINIKQVGADAEKYMLGGNNSIASQEFKSEDARQAANKDTSAYKKWADTYASSEAGVRDLGHIYTQMLLYITPVDMFATMDVPHPDAKQLYRRLISKYFTNTSSSRSVGFKDFVNMKMESDELFSTFVQRINLEAIQINGMQDREIDVTDAIKLSVLVNGVEDNHADTFRVCLQILASTTGSYDEHVAAMRPVAQAAEIFANRAHKAKIAKIVHSPHPPEIAKKAGGGTRDGKGECFSWKGYGECPRKSKGAPCGYTHNGPGGNNRCEVCKGKHHVRYCPSASEKQKANLATTSASPLDDAQAELAQSKAEVAKLRSLQKTGEIAKVAKVQKQVAAAAMAKKTAEETADTSSDSDDELTPCSPPDDKPYWSDDADEKVFSAVENTKKVPDTPAVPIEVVTAEPVPTPEPDPAVEPPSSSGAPTALTDANKFWLLYLMNMIGVFAIMSTTNVVFLFENFFAYAWFSYLTATTAATTAAGRGQPVAAKFNVDKIHADRCMSVTEIQAAEKNARKAAFADAYFRAKDAGGTDEVARGAGCQARLRAVAAMSRGVIDTVAEEHARMAAWEVANAAKVAKKAARKAAEDTYAQAIIAGETEEHSHKAACDIHAQLLRQPGDGQARGGVKGPERAAIARERAAENARLGTLVRKAAKETARKAKQKAAKKAARKTALMGLLGQVGKGVR